MIAYNFGLLIIINNEHPTSEVFAFQGEELLGSFLLGVEKY